MRGQAGSQSTRNGASLGRGLKGQTSRQLRAGPAIPSGHGVRTGSPARALRSKRTGHDKATGTLLRIGPQLGTWRRGSGGG